MRREKKHQMTAGVDTLLASTIRHRLDRGEALPVIEFLSGERGEILHVMPQPNGDIRVTYRLREVGS